MSTTQFSTGSATSAALARSLHDHWLNLLAEGIILCVLGFGAIVFTRVAGLAATLVIGWLLLIAGVVGLVATLRAREAPGFGWALGSALIAMIAGGILLWNPFQGLVTLTFVLMAFFIIDGVLTIAFALAHRRELSRRWEWMMVNGIIDLVLAAILIAGLPGTLFWALGMLVGIDLIFAGASLAGMALQARGPQTTL
jgi:uncharacterized membrane protein HdeD (DUF308 family)